MDQTQTLTAFIYPPTLSLVRALIPSSLSHIQTRPLSHTHTPHTYYTSLPSRIHPSAGIEDNG